MRVALLIAATWATGCPSATGFSGKAKDWPVCCRGEPKSNRSPFLVDLVAETERIDEENKVRSRTSTKKQRAAEQHRQKAKNDLIFRALREEDELEGLRMEERQILDKEKRLRALIET